MNGFFSYFLKLSEVLLIQDYQFWHDRIQQAAYYLIPKPEQPKIHYRIGCLLLQKLPPHLQEEQIFSIVNQLNQGIFLIREPTERIELAKLNLVAARKARAANAYAAAHEYARTSIHLLGQQGWQQQYEITLKLHELAAEVASLCGDFAQMENWIADTIAHSRTPLDRVNVYSVKIQALTSQNKFADSVAAGCEILQELGVHFPSHPSLEDIQHAVQEVNNLIGDRAIESLLELPTMTDPEKLAIMQVAARLIPVCHYAGSPIFPLVVALQVSLSIRYGNSPVSAHSYTGYALFVNGFLKDVASASQFGCLAYRMALATDAHHIRAAVFAPIGLFLVHLKSHLRETLPILQSGYLSGLEVGKLDYAAHNGHGFCLNSYWCGQPLAELEPKIRSYRQQCFDFKQLGSANCCTIVWETTVFLLGNPDQLELTFALEQDAEQFEAEMLAAKDLFLIFYFYLHRAMLRFLFGYLEQAKIDIERARNYLASSAGFICEYGFYFYDSLIALATVYQDPANLETALQRVEQNQCQLKFWSEHAPLNYLHKWQLVEAERYRVLGQKAEALEMYDLAIAGARAHKYIQEEALAQELAAQFYWDWHKENIARTYIAEAHYSYLHWGANAKVKQLETKYAESLQPLNQALSSLSKPRLAITTNSTNSNNANLDLASVMRCSQAIGSEIELEHLLQILMTILIENAGAQSACLLLHKPTASTDLGSFSVAAFSSSDPQKNAALADQLIEEIIPRSILHYVARTRESVVLERAAQEGEFIQDPYIQANQPLSVLCYPLINQGQLVAIVYLENNIITGAFTANRIEFLQLLSGQAAIAISNAQLYAKVRNSEQQLKQFLEAVPVGIGVLDADGHPYYANQKAKELLGQDVLPATKPHEISQVYQTYLAQTEEPYPSDKLPVVRALRGEASNVDDIEIYRGDRKIALEAWGTPIYDEEGQLQYAITVFQDITARKQTEKLLTDYNRTLEQRVAERTAELQQVNQQLFRLATLDELTQVSNRRCFDEDLAKEWHSHLRDQKPLTLILIDIDYFKNYNDYYGHRGGDDCLLRVAQTIAQVPQRFTNLVSRYGGEEFAIILPNTSIERALAIADSVRTAIASLAIPHPNSKVSRYVTLSLGVASLTPNLTLKPEDLINQADAALYAAKHQGRNRAIAYTSQTN